MSKANIRAVRGMNDLLPEQTHAWQWVEAQIAAVLQDWGYGEIRMPIVEKTAVFTQAIGETTDVVTKEMYTFEDRSGDSLSLRPEGTASCVRAMIQAGQLSGGQQHKLWYTGPMFRHERPQKGRYRQFHQFGVEVFNIDGPDVDAELQVLASECWEKLGIDGLTLEINTLGKPEERRVYRERLRDHFAQHESLLDEAARERLEKNPLRLLDSKDPTLAEVIADAPALFDSLGEASRAYFDRYCELLTAAGIDYVHNPRLVRGLDYYTDVVFEWTTTALGAQNAVCSGGRYDELVAMQGGKPAPAVGFAMGLERLLALIDEARIPHHRPAAYLVLPDDAATTAGLALARKLRAAYPGLALQPNLGGGSFKAQFKRADKSGAHFAIILGESELQQGRATVKDLRGHSDQASVDLDVLGDWLQTRLTQHNPDKE